MDIVVRGKNRPVSAALRSLAEEKVAARIARLTHDTGRVEVDFAELRNPRAGECQLCEITVHLTRHFVKAHSGAVEAEAALDLTIDKVEHQVARLKEKRVGRAHRRRRGRLLRVDGTTTAVEVFHADGPADDGAADGDDGSDARIVRTKRFTAKPMVPEEAAMQLDLLGHDFYLFTNAETGCAAVLYRRHDGHLGLIETS